MRSVHLVIPELFLPPDLARSVLSGLQLPALEKLLARADRYPLPYDTLEDSLCAYFGVSGQGIAPVTLQDDGVAPGEGYWLRADPVHLVLVRDQVLLHSGLEPSAEEAAALVESLNRHFEEDGLYFHAPDPQRWYVQVTQTPDLQTRPLGEVLGRDVRVCMPQGEDALHWNRWLNEIQMLLYSHPVNQVREARGALSLNSIWLWGGGAASALQAPAVALHGDDALARVFARVAGMAVGEGALDLAEESNLLVWGGLRAAVQRGDLAAWRDSLQQMEQEWLMPVWQALRSGRLDRVTLDVVRMGGSRRYELSRREGWRVWRRARSLDTYGDD